MKLTNGLLALGLAALPASALALDDTNLFGPGLLRDDASDLVKKLGDKDYKVRRDAFKKLEAMGEEARAALETAAKGDDAETRWNASRLLDRLEDDSSTKPRRGAAQAGRGAEGLKVRGDEDDDGAQAAPPRRRGRAVGSDELERQMRELEQRMREFEKQFEDGGGGFFRGFPGGVRVFDDPFRGFDGGGLHLGPGSSFQRSTDRDGKSESLSIKVDANGHVSAEETKDGKTTKYEADSLEELQKEHPDLLRGGSAVIAIRPGKQDATPHRQVKVKAPVETPSKDAKARDAEEENGEAKAEHKPVLGVELAPVPPAVAEFLELDGGALQVVRVVEDMPAAKRGLKPRDILLEVGGKEVHEFDDVVRALEGADPGKVPLVVLRRGERKKL